ncbi:MAG TPA: hypothetical protein VKB79_21115 [Bryobacteraceae bacterium]|nr:hypothetical protein [Bryobacteraceae bacterium]
MIPESQVIEEPKEEKMERPLSTADVARSLNGEPRDEASIPASGSHAPLFADNELGEFRRRWQDTQTSFVDDPRTAVKNGDELVAAVMARLATLFSDERAKLERSWDSGENVSTEDLRVALQRYRSFFDRLLSV